MTLSIISTHAEHKVYLCNGTAYPPMESNTAPENVVKEFLQGTVKYLKAQNSDYTMLIADRINEARDLGNWYVWAFDMSPTKQWINKNHHWNNCLFSIKVSDAIAACEAKLEKYFA